MTRLKHERALKGLPGWFLQILVWICKGNPPYIMIQKGLFYHLRKRGIPVMFLGVNTEKDLLLALRVGATAILSDRINFMASYLKAKPHLKFKSVY